MTLTMSSESNGCDKMARSYRPVVIVHGLMTGDVSTMVHMATNITKIHPGTKTYVIDRFCGLASLEPLCRQTRMLADDLLQICSLHPEGVHVIGYSQGGLIARGILEMYGDKHNVKTFVSLSSPQGGQYGAECFTKMFPALTTRTAYELFYSRLGQRSLSVANYWYDPRHRDLYLKYSVYLAVIDGVKPQDSDIGNLLETINSNDNNICDAISTKTNFSKSSTDSTIIVQSNDNIIKNIEERVATAVVAISTASVKVAEGHDDVNNSNKECSTTTTIIDAILADKLANDTGHFYLEDDNSSVNTNTMKIGLTRLQKMVLIGGPDDGVISPWQSSQFAVLDCSGRLMPLRERLEDVFSSEDPIGLRQLDTTGRLIEYTIPGVRHHEWHHNKEVLKNYIIDWLD